MIFANIEYLFLLVLLIPYIIWYVMKRKKTEPTLQVSTTRMYMQAPKSWKIYLLHAPFVFRVLAIVMVILVLARPQTTDNWQNTEIEGIDIMLAVDVSTSMLAEDLKPNRLEAAKQVASEFINGECLANLTKSAVSKRYFNSRIDSLSLVSNNLSIISAEVISMALKPKRSAMYVRSTSVNSV